MIKKLFVIAALGLCAFTVNAEVSTTGLTDAQVAELKASVAKIASENQQVKSTGSDPISTAATWGKQASEAAEGFGHAFTVAAKELGITVNEFLATDAGKLTAALIIWKVVGGSLLKCLFLLLTWTIGSISLRVLYTKLFTSEYRSVEYSSFGGWFKGTKTVRIPKTISELDNDGEWLAFVILIAASCILVMITAMTLL